MRPRYLRPPVVSPEISSGIPDSRSPRTASLYFGWPPSPLAMKRTVVRSCCTFRYAAWRILHRSVWFDVNYSVMYWPGFSYKSLASLSILLRTASLFAVNSAVIFYIISTGAVVRASMDSSPLTPSLIDFLNILLTADVRLTCFQC